MISATGNESEIEPNGYRPLSIVIAISPRIKAHLIANPDPVFKPKPASDQVVSSRWV